MLSDVSEENLSSSEDSDDSAVEEVAETDEQRKKIRAQLSMMSFEDLQKLKNELGSKVYNRTVLGVEETKIKKSFKRANKNRPREASSKKRVKLENTFNSIKRQQPRDPRFEPMCGTFDRKTFKENYKFVTDLRQKEKRQLEEEMKETVDPEQKKKLKFVVHRLENQIREAERRDNMEKEEYNEKKEIKDKLKRGEKVQFKKKSVKRLENLISKYEELKKTNKLQKHIERRTKKLVVKERKLLNLQKHSS